MATSWASTSKENQHFARLSKLLIDGGTHVLRDVFDLIHPPRSLRTTLLSSGVHATLKGLRAKRILTTQQWGKLYPASTPVTSGNFDITLLFVLLRNICGLTPPATGWDKPPVAADLSREADLARVKYYRNELYGHTTETPVSDSDFEKYWKEISDVLVRLGGPHYKPLIESLKIDAMDPEEEENFMEALKEWEEMERTFLQKVEEVAAKRMKSDSAADASQAKGDGAASVTYHTTVHGDAAVGHHASFANIERTRGPYPEKDLPSRAKEYTKNLKCSIQRQSDFLLMSEEDKKIKTDDIFTHVTIERGKKHFKESQQRRFGRRQMDEVQDQASTRKLRTCSEMFLPEPRKDSQKSTASVTTANPKTILVTGKAGIGKSLFCQKLVRDWSVDRMFEEVQKNAKVPDFQFVFLLTFRQLLLLEEEKERAFDLLDILNRCPLLDEHSVMDEALLQYVIQNPEKLLIVLDGYDEYKQREKNTSDFEIKYPNDLHHKMPLQAVIAKIMKGKMLKGSVVLISSRPGEAEELKNIAFDVRCDIQGFSSPQVLEYIEKYFKENESMKKKVLDQVKTNEILLSFGHIPVMCFLMCYCIKWFITKTQNTENLPVTRTELYYEVIKLFIKKHSSSKYEEMEETKVQELMHKLGELAMNLTIEGKYIFDEAYLKEFKFNDDEITNLKASGLLDCCPGVRKSPSEKPPIEYTFTHLTIQEFLCAFLFVEKKQIPEEEKTSDVTFMFMAGHCCMKNDEKLMEELIENIKPEDYKDYQRNQLLTLSCLYEYKDSTFSCKIINKQKDRYCTRYGGIVFSRITDMDCLYISYLLNIVNLINEEQTKQHPTFTQSFIVNTLYIRSSSLSTSGIRMLCNSLAVRISSVTLLSLWYCGLDDECVNILSNVLSLTNITSLNLRSNMITDLGVNYLCSVLERGNCRVEVLYLRDNKITNKCVEDVRKQIPDVELKF